LSGACVFKSGAGNGLKIAAHMTGMEFSAIDDTVRTASAEICNMLGRRGRASAELAANTGFRFRRDHGHDYKLHVRLRSFRFFTHIASTTRCSRSLSCATGCSEAGTRE